MQIEKIILSFLDLEPNWHFGEGDVINLSAVIYTLILVSLARYQGFEEGHAVPLITGGISFTTWYGHHELEFIIDNTIEFYLTYNDKDIIHKENMTFKEAISEIEKFTY